uniref:Uncharacterized protein n=1 Tax=Trypanosoma congolense (strain IL3000) TaxID=1068625 RepID=G0UZ70_TRYCI|nr:conserved hypothetical protein [Trypanosoma congolense IL3000]
MFRYDNAELANEYSFGVDAQGEQETSDLQRPLSTEDVSDLQQLHNEQELESAYEPSSMQRPPSTIEGLRIPDSTNMHEPPSMQRPRSLTELPAVRRPDSPTRMEDMNEFSDSEDSLLKRVRAADGVSDQQEYHDAQTVSPFPGASAISNTKTVSQLSERDTTAADNGDGMSGATSKVRVQRKSLDQDVANAGAFRPSDGERAQLIERWKNAMAEEERLNVLQHQMESQMRASWSADMSPNFPPKFLCMRPVVSHNIGSVPESRRRYVKISYINWMVTCVTIVANAAVSITIAFSPDKSGHEGAQGGNPIQTTLLSLLYLLGIPLGFITCHFPLYKACCTGLSTRHMVSICGLFIGMLSCLFMAIGPVNTGACGLLLLLDVCDSKSVNLAIPLGIVLGIWTIEVFYFMYCLVAQWRLYRMDVNLQSEARRHIASVVGA